MTVKVSFADLTHMGQVVAANTFPLGLTMVASYAKQMLGDGIDLDVFKYPEDFASYLDDNTPSIACFSAFSWNIRLGHAYAKQIKQANPKTITVFGGPNFPDSPEDQEIFLKKYPYIDCYFEFEGEISFVEFFRAMEKTDFDWPAFRDDKQLVQNIRYISNGEFVAAPLAEKINDLNILPSPHLNGISDKFYDGILLPMIQTTRGCPYQCAFCWEGGPYFRKVKRFDQSRVHEELRYIAERVGTVHDLCLVDANFGMFPEDMDTAREIYDIQQSHENHWPRTILTATAKNNKERTMEIVDLLGDTMPPTGAVQTTNEEVLKNVKRKNPPLELLAKLAARVENQGGQSEAEIILCLEGDDKEKHFQTVTDMLDAKFSFIRMYQFMMLPGTRSAGREHRGGFGFETRYRVLPRCFGVYRFRDQEFPCAEIEEIVVGTSTMPHRDYQACRELHLTVETFNNDSLFFDLLQFLKLNNISRSDFIKSVHRHITEGDGALTQRYAEFRTEEERNLWPDIAELEAFVAKPGVIGRYVEGEYGTNELYKYRALAIFEHIEELHQIVFSVAKILLREKGALSHRVGTYLDELSDFSLLRKQAPLETDRRTRRVFNFDFERLLSEKFQIDPFDAEIADGAEFDIYHTDDQRGLIDGYIHLYSTSLIGLGRILLRANMNRLYRTVHRAKITAPH